MTKNKQLLKELEKRVSHLESIIKSYDSQASKDTQAQASYGEVIDEWLNGVKH